MVSISQRWYGAEGFQGTEAATGRRTTRCGFGGRLRTIAIQSAGTSLFPIQVLPVLLGSVLASARRLSASAYPLSLRAQVPEIPVVCTAPIFLSAMCWLDDLWLPSPKLVWLAPVGSLCLRSVREVKEIPEATLRMLARGLPAPTLEELLQVATGVRWARAFLRGSPFHGQGAARTSQTQSTPATWQDLSMCSTHATPFGDPRASRGSSRPRVGESPPPAKFAILRI